MPLFRIGDACRRFEIVFGREMRRSTRCRSWEAGPRPRWYGVTRISRPSTWRLMPNVCRTSVCFARSRGGGLGHNKVAARKMKGLASLQALDLLVAGTGFEPVTFGL